MDRIMPAKRNVHALPRHMTAYTRKGRTAYKYVRRVPQDLHDVLQRKLWDLSLGSDQERATTRCHAYMAQHDQLIARLSSDDARAEYVSRQDSEAAAELAELAVLYEDAPQLAFDGKTITFADDVSGAPGIKLSWEREDQELWSNTRDALKRAESMSKRSARDHLALFAAYAFGDKSHLERLDAADAWPAP